MLELPSNACCLGSGRRRTFDADFGGAFDSDETDARDHDGVNEILTRDFSGTTSDGTPSGDDACNAYSAGWQPLEERVDSNYLASPGLNERVQHVWGKRYIDDAILHRQDRPESGHPGGNGPRARA